MQRNSPCFDFVLLVGQQLEFDVGICCSRCLGFSISLQLSDVGCVSWREKTAVHVTWWKTPASDDRHHQRIPIDDIAELENQCSQLSILAVINLVLVWRLQLANNAFCNLIFGRVLCGGCLGRQRIRCGRLHARQRFDWCGRWWFFQIMSRCTARRPNCTCWARGRLERERRFGGRLFVLSTHSTCTKACGNRKYGC